MNLPSEAEARDNLQEALVIIGLLRTKLDWTRILAVTSEGEAREERLWQAEHLHRRMRYWERRAVRLISQLEETDDWPSTYLHLMRTSTEVHDDQREQKGALSQLD